MSGRMLFASTAEMFLWNAGGGVPYKSASERKQIMLNVQGKRVYERLVECAAVRSTAGGGVPYKCKRQQIPISKPSSDLKLIVLQEVRLFRADS